MSNPAATSAAVEATPPARPRARLRRMAPLVAVLAVVVGVAVLDLSEPTAPSPAGASTRAVAVAPIGAESSSWYCAGGTGDSGQLAMPTVYLTNVGSSPVPGTFIVVSDSGSTASEPVDVPPRTQLALSPAALAHGSWVATRVDLEGGGVVATQSVDGPTGWAEAPCASATSHAWYFASGSTTGGHDLFVSLFNPTDTDAVVDLSFRTPSGLLSQPPPFQGILVPPGGLAVADVGSYLQGADDVSTDAVTRAGLVVADELEIATGNRHGTSLRLGTPAPVRSWALPRTVNVTGGTSVVHVYNPTAVAQSVTASFRLPSGPTAPLTLDVGPGATSVLTLSSTTRLPRNDDFATRITADGPGVVVDRVLEAPASAKPPQWGAALAVDQYQWAGASGGARSWLLPAPGVPGHPATAAAAPFAVALLDQGPAAVTVHVGVLTAAGVTPLSAPITLTAGGATVVEPSVITPAGLRPIVVTASGPLAVTEDLVPAGSPGIVTLPGIALPGGSGG